MAKGKQQQQRPKPAKIRNRKARHEYHVLEVLECGIELTGTEVKSLRAGQARVDEAYVRVRDGELWLVGVHVAPYPQAQPNVQHDPDRDRRLLAHKRQIVQIESHVRQKGKTVIPLSIYFKKGWAKCEIGIVTGKREYDKRRDIKAREHKRDIAREMSRRNR